MINRHYSYTNTISAFGRRAPQRSPAEVRLSRLLSRRLREKIDNYEETARRLRHAGDLESAKILCREAEKLRFITRRA